MEREIFNVTHAEFVEKFINSKLKIGDEVIIGKPVAIIVDAHVLVPNVPVPGYRESLIGRKGKITRLITSPNAIDCGAMVAVLDILPRHSFYLPTLSLVEKVEPSVIKEPVDLDRSLAELLFEDSERHRREEAKQLARPELAAAVAANPEMDSDRRMRVDIEHYQDEHREALERAASIEQGMLRCGLSSHMPAIRITALLAAQQKKEARRG